MSLHNLHHWFVLPYFLNLDYLLPHGLPFFWTWSSWHLFFFFFFSSVGSLLAMFHDSSHTDYAWVLYHRFCWCTSHLHAYHTSHLVHLLNFQYLHWMGLGTKDPRILPTDLKCNTELVAHLFLRLSTTTVTLFKSTTKPFTGTRLLSVNITICSHITESPPHHVFSSCVGDIHPTMVNPLLTRSGYQLDWHRHVCP